MCEICLQSPCNPRCPNADEPKEVYTCAECRDPIYVGDNYVELAGVYLHEDCVTIEILLDELGTCVKEAELDN